MNRKALFFIVLCIALFGSERSFAQRHVSDYVFSQYYGEYYSIAETGTVLPLNSDNAAAQVYLPFEFPFGNERYRCVTATSDGLLCMGYITDYINSVGSANSNFSYWSLIAPFCADLSMGVRGVAYYEVVGTSPNRVAVFEYSQVRQYGTSHLHEVINFQALLHENGNIEFVYDSCVLDSRGGSAYIGLFERGANSGMWLYGSWANPEVRTESRSFAIDSSSFPRDGYTFSFARMSECAAPSHFRCSTFDSLSGVRLEWQPALGSNMWDVRYDIAGTSANSMRYGVFQTTDSSFLCSGLSEGVGYDAYVRTVCDVPGQPWVGPVTFSLGHYHAHGGLSDTVQACDGDIHYDFSSDAMFGTSSMLLRPSFPDSRVVLSGGYNLDAPASSFRIYDGESASGRLLYSGSGSGVTLPQIVSTSGSLLLVIESHPNGAVAQTANLHVSCQPTAICSMVRDLVVDRLAGTSAHLSWITDGGYIVPSVFRTKLVNLDNPLSSPLYDTTSRYDVLYSGLEPNTHYRVVVSGICDGEPDDGDSVEFVTRCLSGGNTLVATGSNVRIGDIPVCSEATSTASQSIFTADELRALGLTPGNIMGISYGWSGVGVSKEVKVFIEYTDFDKFSTQRAVFDNSMAPVYQGIRHAGDTGRVSYMFTTPWVWDGVHNIMVTTFVNQLADTASCAAGFSGYCTPVRDSVSLIAISNVGAFTNTNISSASMYFMGSRPDISFLRPCDSASCVAPTANVTSIEPTEVDVEWAPGSDEQSWFLWHKEVGDSSWTLDDSNVTETHYQFVGLQPMTNYLFKIAPNCTGYYAYDMLSVHTPCDVMTELPYYEYFDCALDDTGSCLVPCWYLYSSTVVAPFRNTETASLCIKNRQPNTPARSYAVLPLFAAPLNQLLVEFDAQSIYYPPVQIGVMSDPEDFATFEPLDTVMPTGTWHHYMVQFNRYTGTGRYMAFASAGDDMEAYLDNVVVRYSPDCETPSDFMVVAVSSHTATLHWSDSDTATYEVEYGLAGYTPGTGLRNVVTADSVVLNGLDVGTRYEARVRRLCTLDSSEWTEPVGFLTNCSTIGIPFETNFGSTEQSHTPECWTCGGANYNPTVRAYTAAVAGKALAFESIYNGNNVYAIMPKVDDAYPIETLMARFRAWWSESNLTTRSERKVVVGLCRNNAGVDSYIPVDTVEVSGLPRFYEVTFEHNAGAGQYIAFIDAPGMANFYIDSIVVDTIPQCRIPRGLSVTHIGVDSAVVAWNVRDSAHSWLVEYGPRGFALGTGTSFVSATDTVVLHGLAAVTGYDVYVRSICDPNRMSDWSEVCQFTTLQLPAVLPYCVDFEDSTEWSKWQTMSVGPESWCSGTAWHSTPYGYGDANHALYLSADSGVTCTLHGSADYSRSIAFRDIDFGTIDTSVAITVWVAVGGSHSQGSDCCRFYVADPDQDIDFVSNTSPWSNGYTVEPSLTFTSSTLTWHVYTITLDSVSGVHRLLIWRHSSGTTDLHPVAIDDICVDYVACPRPTNLRLVNATMGSADLTWNGPSDCSYIATIRSSFGGIYGIDTVPTNSIHYSSLNAHGKYYLTVSRLCDSASVSEPSETFVFKTLACNDDDEFFVGDSTSTTTASTLILNTEYPHTYSQQIINASELPGPSIIKGVKLFCTSVSHRLTTSINVCLAHTEKEYFDNADDFDASALLSQVYSSGQFVFRPGWNSIIFDTPFAYNGTDNLIIYIQIGYNGRAVTFPFRVTPTGQMQALSWVSDYDNRPTDYAFNGRKNVFAYHASMILDICPPEDCPTPILRTPYIRYEGVTLRWRNTGTNYLISYRQGDESRWIVKDSSLTDTFFVTPMLRPYTDYVYAVQQQCDSSGISPQAIGTFNASDLQCLPSLDFALDSVSPSSASFSWSPDESHVSYQVRIFNTYYDYTKTSYVARCNITTLTPGVSYHAAMRVRCEEYEDYSFWSDTLSFTTPACPNVSNLVLSDLSGNSVVADWVDEGIASEWQLEWGRHGFSQGAGTSIIVNTHPYTISGLMPETEYDLYVRVRCGENYFSNQWVGVTFTTTQAGIADISDMDRIMLFPNPTESEAVLLLPSVAEMLHIDVVDVSGRICQQAKVPAETGQYTLKTDNLASGTYYVRIYGSSLNAVKKLVVR